MTDMKKLTIPTDLGDLPCPRCGKMLTFVADSGCPPMSPTWLHYVCEDCGDIPYLEVLGDKGSKPEMASDFDNGYRMAAAGTLQLALNQLGYEGSAADHSKWILERARAISTLRDICNAFGDNDWDDNLHMSDIIDKHLRKYLETE